MRLILKMFILWTCIVGLCCLQTTHQTTKTINTTNTTNPTTKSTNGTPKTLLEKMLSVNEDIEKWEKTLFINEKVALAATSNVSVSVNDTQAQSQVAKSTKAKRQISMLDLAAYDYYDWVCTGDFCQLCDVLTGECCDPDIDANCYLPDSCANNPCLSGGTCTSTFTIDNQPDFVCTCREGLTGKYCQLINQFNPPVMLHASFAVPFAPHASYHPGLLPPLHAPLPPPRQPSAPYPIQAPIQSPYYQQRPMVMQQQNNLGYGSYRTLAQRRKQDEQNEQYELEIDDEDDELLEKQTNKFQLSKQQKQQQQQQIQQKQQKQQQLQQQQQIQRRQQKKQKNEELRD